MFGFPSRFVKIRLSAEPTMDTSNMYSEMKQTCTTFKQCLKLDNNVNLLENNTVEPPLKCHYDENRILQIRAILRHKQVAYTRVKMLFTVFKYLFSFQRYSSF